MTRPWDREKLRLGLKLDTNRHGWWLFRLEHIGDRGEVPIDQDTEKMQPADYALTSAEFAALRRDCGLSQAEAREFLGTSQKTMSHWENRLGAPAQNYGRANDLAALRNGMANAVKATVNLAREKGTTDVDLFAYRAGDYSTSVPASEGLPHGAHWRLLTLTADALTAIGCNVTIRYADDL